MKRLILQLGFSLLAALLLIVSPVHAGDNVNVTVNVAEIFGLTISGDLDWVGQYSATKACFDAVINQPWESQGYGWTLPKKSLKIHIYSNAGWTLWIKGSPNSFFDVTPGGWTSKPLSDILWLDGDPDDIWRALSTTDTLVITDPHPPAGYYEESVSFHVLLHYEHDLPGLYTYNYVTFTATHD